MGTGQSDPTGMIMNQAGLPGAPPSLAAFIDLIKAGDVEEAIAMALQVRDASNGKVRLRDEYLAAAARSFGTMWNCEDVDFMTVTLAVYRLGQVLKSCASDGDVVPQYINFSKRILLLPVPGEQHRFGIDIVSAHFREACWDVATGPAMSHAKLVRLIRDEWFDVVALSVTAERYLANLPACIRAMRKASANPFAFILLGGYAISNNEERARFLGADATARTPEDALEQAEAYLDSVKTGKVTLADSKKFEAG